jgi:hypothetical protein
MVGLRVDGDEDAEQVVNVLVPVQAEGQRLNLPGSGHDAKLTAKHPLARKHHFLC